MTDSTPTSASTVAELSPSKNSPPKKVVVLSLLYGLFFLVMLVAAYTGHLPVHYISQFHNADKVGHLLLYFIPSYLGHLLFRCHHIKRFHLPLFPSIFTLFTITEELIQGFSPNRTLDAGDMVCSLLGIVVGYWLAQRQAHTVRS